ncbi:hypothetical protein PoB_007447200 [Plakobranchus ocellatus]|uniref:Uncharacterized protein n=1 Tax=Plakobranchus ocellatus TaxID=259542 RepID=A0AAV4DUG1_9GAST|nr:hypothetical protein PoB_007447200 [Plakobranchus ocellatus]
MKEIEDRHISKTGKLVKSAGLVFMVPPEKLLEIKIDQKCCPDAVRDKNGRRLNCTGGFLSQADLTSTAPDWAPRIDPASTVPRKLQMGSRS